MDDTFIFLLGGLCTLILSFIAGAIGGYITVHIRLDSLMSGWRDVIRMGMTEKSKSGVEARERLTNEMTLAIGEALELFKNPELTAEERNTKIMALVQKYPNVAVHLAKKAGIKL
jgi:hypothetical protein